MEWHLQDCGRYPNENDETQPDDWSRPAERRRTEDCPCHRGHQFRNHDWANYGRDGNGVRRLIFRELVRTDHFKQGIVDPLDCPDQAGQVERRTTCTYEHERCRAIHGSITDLHTH